MNPYIKQDWARELRAGNFIQITGDLRGDKNERCALGVLIDVFIKYHPRVSGWSKTVNGTWELAIHDGLGRFERHETSCVLPQVVAEWAGLGEDVDPEVEVFEEDDVYSPQSISQCNDDVGMEFGDIADAIERDL
jgi:hypothetical protein